MLKDLGLLIARSVVGGRLAAHGARNVFGSLDGPGPAGAPPFAKAASYTELAAGSLIALGAGGALGPALLISTMIGSQPAVHAKDGSSGDDDGVAAGTLHGAAALALAMSGPGRLSFDGLFRMTGLHKAWINWLLVAGGVAVGLATLALRDTDGTQTASTAPPASEAAATPPAARERERSKNGAVAQEAST